VTRRTVLAIVGLLALHLAIPGFALAHEGHNHKLMGVISMVHENHLEVKDAKGKASTFTLDAKTRIRRGKATLKTADLKAGDRVVVLSRETKDKATGKSTINVVEVQVGVATTATK
jgi:hypothetical protein